MQIIFLPVFYFLLIADLIQPAPNYQKSSKPIKAQSSKPRQQQVQWLHGTEGRTTLPMLASSKHEVLPYSKLVDKGIVPISGELSNGISIVNGVNQKGLSVVSAKNDLVFGYSGDWKMVWQYANGDISKGLITPKGRFSKEQHLKALKEKLPELLARSPKDLDTFQRLSIALGQIRMLDRKFYGETMKAIGPELKSKKRELHRIVNEKYRLWDEASALDKTFKQNPPKLDFGTSLYSRDDKDLVAFANTHPMLKRSNGKLWTENDMSNLPKQHLRDDLTSIGFILRKDLSREAAIWGQDHAKAIALNNLVGYKFRYDDHIPKETIHHRINKVAKFWNKKADIKSLSKKEIKFMEKDPLPIVFGSTKPQEPGFDFTKPREQGLSKPGKLGENIDTILVENRKHKKEVQRWLRQQDIGGVDVHVKKDYEHRNNLELK